MTTAQTLKSELTRWCAEHVAFMLKEGLNDSDFDAETLVDGAIEDPQLWKAFTACASEAAIPTGNVRNVV